MQFVDHCPSADTHLAQSGAEKTTRFGSARLKGGKSIYVLHDLKTLQADPAASIDVIISGHSHLPKIDTVGGVLYLNPGSAGPRRFKLRITLATLDVSPEGMRPEIHDLGGD